MTEPNLRGLEAEVLEITESACAVQWPTGGEGMKGAVGIALAIVFAAPVEAQTNREILPPSQVRILVAKYAQCVVRMRHEQVREAVLSWWTSGQDDFPVIDECARAVAFDTVEMRFPPETYRYAMAEALYTADFGRTPLASFERLPLVAPAQVPPLDEARLPRNATRAQSIRDAHDRRLAERYLLIIGDCVSRYDTNAVHALLIAPVESGDEAKAIAAVQPTVAQCLPKDQTARFNRMSLRGVLALASYRLSDAARTQSGGDVPHA